MSLVPPPPAPHAQTDELVVDVRAAGAAIAGTVVRVGAGTSGFAIGDPVAACVRSEDEQVAVDVRLVVSLRAGLRTLSFEEGVLFAGTAVEAYHVLVDVVRVATGETLLIQDAGTEMGRLAVQFARAIGAGAIFGVGASEAQCEAARQAGCTEAMLPHGFVERIRALTGGRGVDVVLESALGDRALESRKVLAPQGRIAFAATPLVRHLFQTATVRRHAMGELATDVRETWQRAARSAMAYVASGAVRLEPVSS